MFFSVAHISEPLLNLVGYGSCPMMTLGISQVLLLGGGCDCTPVPGLPAFLRGLLRIRHSPRSRVAQVFVILFSTPDVQGLLIKRKE